MQFHHKLANAKATMLKDYMSLSIVALALAAKQPQHSEKQNSIV